MDHTFSSDVTLLTYYCWIQKQFKCGGHDDFLMDYSRKGKVIYKENALQNLSRIINYTF